MKREDKAVKGKVGYRIIGALLAVFLIAIVLMVFLIKKFSPNKEHITEQQRNPVAAGEARVLFWQEEYEKTAKKVGDTWYLDLPTICERVNKRFFYDGDEQVLTVTTPNEIIRVKRDEAFYQSNKQKTELDFPPVISTGGVVYIAIPFAAMFSDLTYTMFEEPNRILFRQGECQLVCLTVKNATALRESPSIKAKIVLDLKKEEKLWYTSAHGESLSGFTKVMTESGIFGYAKKKDLSESFFETVTTGYQEPVYPHISFDEPVVLGWHQVTNKKANDTLQGMIQDNGRMNVISPTWFRISDEEGNISSLADESYVAKAKELGLKVWGLVDNFSSEVDTLTVLKSTEKRERLMNALLSEAIRVNLDGINVDFEMLSLATGPYFIEFLREFSVKCRANGLVLSVDNYVPSAHAAYYDMKSQGEVVDYVIIMAYDEHYSGSTVAGSVSSYGYVTNAVDDVLKMVAADQVIIAVPFYTRLWMQTADNGKEKLTSEALSMQAAEEELRKNDVSAEWNDSSRQYFATYQKGNATYLIWLEEENSLREKLLYIKQANVAGAAVWRLGFEKKEIWDLFDFDNLTKKEINQKLP